MISGADSFCLISRPIYIGSDDNLSPHTARQILIHNEKWEKICK